MEKSLKNVIGFKDFEKSPKLAEIKVSYQLRPRKIIKISNPIDSYNVLYPLFDLNTIEFKEDFYMLILNRANYLLGWFKLSSGGTSGTVVDVKIIFALALLTNASGLVLCHNHPSQNIQPSQSDIDLTNRVKEAGKLFSIAILDHLIVAPHGAYFTFADTGLL